MPGRNKGGRPRKYATEEQRRQAHAEAERASYIRRRGGAAANNAGEAPFITLTLEHFRTHNPTITPEPSAALQRRNVYIHNQQPPKIVPFSKMSTSSRISLHVRITVAPENVEKFLEHLKPVYDAVTAEPECVFFEVFQNPAVPGEFKFIENWHASQEWLKDVQLKREYYAPYVAATEPMWTKPRTFEVWERMPNNAWVTVKTELTESYP